MNDTRKVGDILVTRITIIGTEHEVFEAWERGGPVGRHHTIRTIDGVWYGRVGTDALPADLEALKPGSQERFEKVRAWHESEYERAYQAIVAAFPEAADGRRSMGDISLAA